MTSASSITSSNISSSSSLSAPVSGAPSFKNQRPQIKEMLAETPLYEVVANIVADYAVGDETYFGPNEWEKYFGLNVKEAPELDKNFYKFWNGPDPVDATKQVCETHLPPVLHPASLSLRTLGQLVTKPTEGLSSKYAYNIPALSQNEETEAGPACWLVMRKDVLARNESYAQQVQSIKEINEKTKAGYEEGPSAVALATVVFTRYVSNKERHLGDATGMENCWTFSHCKETVKYGDMTYQVVVGGFEPGCLNVYDDICAHETVGVAALRKF